MTILLCSWFLPIIDVFTKLLVLIFNNVMFSITDAEIVQTVVDV